MTEKLSDEWQTPDWLFKELDEEFSFDIDLCATRENSKCDFYYRDYLKNINVMFGAGKECVGRPRLTSFMNPPYSNPKPFIEKAWEDSKHCKIVCLVKCDPSTKWWSTFWGYKNGHYCPECGGGLEVWHDRWQCRDNPRHQAMSSPAPYSFQGPKPGCEVRFFPRRIKFDPPKGFEGKASSPSFPSALIIMDRRSL